MTAIQKAREELRGQLALLHSLANDTTEANWRDKRLYILQTCVRMSDALAARDAETPTTPADVGELVERLLRERKVHLGDIVAVRALLEDVGADAGEAAATLIAQATALELVTRERDEARAWSERHHADLLAAEAKLAEAQKVIEPFAEHAQHYRRSDDEWAVGKLKAGHFRAASRFLEETK